MKRVMCLYLPFLPIERTSRKNTAPPPESAADGPLVLTERVGSVVRVAHTNRAAQRAGIRSGMTLAEARAVAPHLDAQPHEPQHDTDGLERLALWAQRFSPRIEAQPPDTLLVDATGCERLFRRNGHANGEENLIRLAVDGLAAEGFSARAAIADTIGGAWALTHAGPDRRVVVSPGQSVAELMPLPPWSLRLPAEVAANFDALGIDRIETLIHLPRSAVATRFGDAVLRRIDQATGDEVESLEPLKPVTLPAAGMGFPAPTQRQEVVYTVADRLLESIGRQLARRCAGIRSLGCAVYREDHPPECFEVRFAAPTRNARHIGSLLKTRLERVDLSTGITGLGLWSPETFRIVGVQRRLFEDETSDREEDGAAVGELVDRLSNRLGRQAVVRHTLLDNHLPEHAFRSDPAIESIDDASRARAPCDEAAGPRPLRLFARPQPAQVLVVLPDGPVAWFRWAGQERPVLHTLGPERIATSWWAGVDVQRDYFVVLSKDGCRFWLFRDRRSDRWFVHGCFD